MKYFFLTFFFVIQTADAAIATPESFFRNGSNKEITTNTVLVEFVVNEVFNEKDQITRNESEKQKILNLEANNMELSKRVPTEKYVLAFFNMESEGDVRYLQATYNKKPNSKEREISDVYYHPRFLGKLEKENLQTDHHLFYSTLVSLALNKAEGFVGFFDKKVPQFSSNKKLLNKNKLKLLERYKNYLKFIKDDPGLKDVLSSPIKVDNEEEQKKINEVMSESMYQTTDSVSLVKEGKDFFWKVDLGDFKALFNNDKHQLHNFVYQGKGVEFELECYNFMLFNGIHELPKNIIVKGTNGKIYTITMVRLRHFNYRTGQFIRKYEEKKEDLKNARKNQTIAVEQSEEVDQTLFTDWQPHFLL